MGPEGAHNGKETLHKDHHGDLPCRFHNSTGHLHRQHLFACHVPLFQRGYWTGLLRHVVLSPDGHQFHAAVWKAGGPLRDETDPGYGVFSLGSLLSGLSVTLVMLILARGLQGLGGAMLFTSAFSSISRVLRGVCTRPLSIWAWAWESACSKRFSPGELFK